MANLMAVSLLILALTSGLWYGGEGRKCETPIEFANCDKEHPVSCTRICRSGLYFPPYFFIDAVCVEKFMQGHFVYYCKCIWECDGSAASPVAQPLN